MEFCSSAQSPTSIPSGPVAQAFRRASALVTGESDPPIWEIKHRLAASHHLQDARNDFRCAGRLGRIKSTSPRPGRVSPIISEPKSKALGTPSSFTETAPTTPSMNGTISRRSASSTKPDVISLRRLRTVRLNWDFDFKNEPVEPVVDVEGVISFLYAPVANSSGVREPPQGFRGLAAQPDVARSRQRATITTSLNGLRFVRRANCCGPARMGCCLISPV